MVFGDERHRKTKLGRAAKYEVRIRRDASGKIAPPEKDGVLKAKNRRVTQKSHNEARSLILVAEVKVVATAAGNDDDHDDGKVVAGGLRLAVVGAAELHGAVDHWDQRAAASHLNAEQVRRRGQGV